MGRADSIEKSVERNGTSSTQLNEAVEPCKGAREPKAQSTTPLSFAQRRLWFLEEVNPGTAAYNMPLVARLKGQLNLFAFQRALEAVILRHESLRTRFPSVNGEPRQVIDRDAHVEVEIGDLAAVEGSERENELKRRIHNEINRPFDLANDRLIRVLVLRLATREHIAVFTMHHIVSDEWSLSIFLRELGLYYEGFATGKPLELPDLPIQYGDFAAWQQDWLQGEGLEEQIGFWKKQLKGNPPALEMPTDFPRRQTVSSKGKTLTRFLSREMETSLRNLAKREEATLFMVLLAAFKILLYRYTQQEDIIVSSPMSGRNRVELEGLIGFFVNILPLRTSLSNNPSFRNVLRRVKEVTLDACAHQDASFEKIVEELHPERASAETPFARVLFMVQHNSFERMSWRTGMAGMHPGDSSGSEAPNKDESLDIQFVEAQTDTSKFELSVNVQETTLGLAVRAEYNTQLFQEQTIERLLQHLEILLGGIIADPELRVSELPVLSDREKQQLLVEWNNTCSNYPREKCIHELFEEHARQTPESIAAVFGQSSLTFGELNRRANQLASYLERYRIEPNTPVGICVKPSLEMLIGMLGVLKAGGAYVPLDPAYPIERLAFMLRDTGTPVVITQQALLERIPGDFANVVCLDADCELIASHKCDNRPNRATAGALAYVMYTSGSTGQPKGVRVPHRAVARLAVNSNYIRLDSTDRIGQVSNISFDAATFEIWGALLNGAQLVGITNDVAISPSEFARELKERGITAIFLTSALFTQVANEAPEAFESLRTVIAGGEALDPKSVRAVLQSRPPQRLVNGYGPTENTTFTCCHHIRDLPETTTNVPIGRPISNTQVYILDPFLNPVPIGVPGELYAGGDGLADGYWKRPELTAEKFVPNPFFRASNLDTQRESALLYRTGDRAKYLPNGDIEFLGRIDDQIKIRGFRVELGEIEAALRSHELVRECAVTVFGNGAVDKRLIAYVVPKKEKTPALNNLRTFVRRTLPDYMVPAAFVLVDSLPLTPNGKLHRAALPDPSGVLHDSESYQAPRDEVETKLARIWEDVLDTRPVGIRDRFFDLGGHSLLAVQLVSRIEKEFSKKLRVASIFQAQTIEELSALLREEAKVSEAKSSVVQIQAKGNRPPLFLVHGAGGGMFWGYANLSRHLGTLQPLYGFRSRGLDGMPEFTSIEEMARQYVSDLRNVQASGPYYLGGYCFGGIVAYEMACQLASDGEEVALLALLNCAPPNSRYTRVRWNPLWCLRFLKNLRYWAKYVRELTPAKRREFARWKWHRLKQGLRRGSELANGYVDVGNLVDLSSFAKEERKVWEEHIRALLKYQPRRYDGKVHLFRSPGHQVLCSFDADYGWGEFVERGVAISIVSGAHETILEEPCVGAVAVELKKLLDTQRQPQMLKIETPLLLGVEIPIQLNGDSRQKSVPQAQAGRWPTAVPEIELKGVNRQCTKTSAPLLRSQPRELCNESAGPDISFWTEHLADAPALLELPTDHPRPAIQSGQTETEARELSSALIANSSENRRLVALGGLFALLRRCSNQNDLVVASSLVDVDVSDLFVLRINLSDDPTAEELLHRIRENQGEAIRNRSWPFLKLVGELYPNPDSSYQPLCQVAFSHRTKAPRLEPDGKFDLHFEVEDSEATRLKISYAKDLFEPDTICRMLAQWETLMRDMVEHPTRRVSELTLLPPEEESLVSVEWNNTRMPYPREKSLFQLFEEQAVRTPNAEALVCGNIRLTYSELLARARAVAFRLNELRIGPESLVGICLGRSWQMVAGILGALKAGGAYVPMDPAYPKERIAFILNDAKAGVLLTERKQVASLPNTEAQTICLDEFDWDSAEWATLSASESRPPAEPGRSPLAYVIYTSGSTGQPKGVAIEHRNAVAFVSWAKEVFSAEELSGVLASTSICFDLSIFEMFVPLCLGGKVILAENALALPSLPAAREVKLINTVPSAIRELLRIKGVPQSVQVINLAGEPLATALVNDIYAQTAVCKVYDLYGPTETTTYSTFTLRKPNEPPSIGRPLSNEQIYLLDANMRLVPIGVPGDLYIGGDGVARGYLNRPELTAEKFFTNPFPHNSCANGAANRLYKTGDLARWRADGRLEFLGRRDHQVKIRGFRIELGEIETALKKQAPVRDAVVLAREDQPGIKRLVAYVASGECSKVNAESLREGLKDALPGYMVPSTFVFLERLPLTPNGKIDRKALPAPPEDRSGLSQDFLPPSSPVERQLVTIWREILPMKEIGVQDNFFDLGGNSLLAVQIISRIRESFNFELPMSALFDAPTICALAQQLSSPQRDPGAQSLPALEPIGRDSDLPVSFVQERLWFLEQIRPESCAYNVPIAFRLTGALDLDAFQKAFDQIVDRHESLRTTFYFANGNLCQAISPVASIKISVTDASNDADAQRLVNAEARFPFDLAIGPLVRGKLLRLADSEHIFVLVMHHIISDGWSLGIFLRELETAYRSIINGSRPELPPLAVQYVDFAVWRRESLQGNRLESELNFWKGKLEGAPSAIALPADESASSVSNGKAGHVCVQLPAPLAQAVLQFGRHDGTTPFVVLMTALAITLRKWTGQKDMVIGTVVAGRNRRELESVIGCFMNFLPVRIAIDGRETGREILAAVRTAAMEAQNHQDCPFEKMVETLNPERRLNQNPLYNVALLFQNFSLDFFTNGSIRATPFPALLDAALLDLRFEAEQTPQGLSILCEYNAGLFKRATIEQLTARCCQVLETLVKAPDSAFERFPALAVQKTAPATSEQRDGAQTIAIAGTFTAEPLGDSLRYWLEHLGMPATIEFAAYSQAFQQLLDPSSLFATNRRGLNVILLRFEDWTGPTEATSAQQCQNVQRNLSEFAGSLGQASLRSSVPHLVCICPVSNHSAIANRALDFERELARQLEPLAGIHVLTSAELGRLYPVAEFYDASGEELGHIPYTPQFFTGLATAIARKFHALNRAGHKVIVLDLDQTLWSGVCGEDGPEGIRMDEPRLALQKFMRAQQQAGMLLCLCSKNNEEDVWEVFEKRADLLLRKEHFAACRLNWRPKSENLKSLAEELQLGLDSFIFVDDNPVECAEVEANCPQALTLQLPDDPKLIPRFFEHCWVFDHLKLTPEDRHRAELYRENRQREQFRSRSANLDDFLAELELQVTIKPMSDEELPRVAQLTQRTNQFNCTTHRRTETDIRQLSVHAEILTVAVSDRFGDYGLTGVIIFSANEKSLEVETFLLSCRILGRGIEHRVLARLGEIALERKLEWVGIHFNPSAKNKPALDFLRNVGEPFQQPLNGGYIFRFPAEVASQISLCPEGDDHDPSLLKQRFPIGSPSNAESGTSNAQCTKFSLCRQIALELNEPARIHAKIESKNTVRHRTEGVYSAPGTEVESQLCKIWQSLLHIDRVGITDNFFEIGGHSLLAVRLFAEIQQVFGKKLPLVTIFQSPTIEQLARSLSESNSEAGRSLVVPLQPKGSKPPLFLVHGAGGDILWGYANLSAHMPQDQPIFGIKSSGQAGRQEFTRIEDMADCYVKELQLVQPHGPYYLGGYCFGGNVAYEMARQLRAADEEVAFVALLDSAPANAGYDRLHWWAPKYGLRFLQNLYYWLVDFAQQSPKERRKFIRRKLRTFARKLTWRRGPRCVDLESIIDTSQFPQEELRLWQVHLQALINHVQRPYPGDVLLLRTRGQPILCSLENDFCWGKLAQNGVQVTLIPGSHENIFMEPNVRTLAKELGFALTEAQRNRR